MKIHFIGIGGIGISAIAQYYKSKGHEVSGSDLVNSEITDLLKNKGIKIYIGHSKENITKDLDIIAFSPAVEETNIERQTAKEYGIKEQTSPELLGEITKEHFTIAVCGSHGKSTTSAMIALMLERAGLDPTVIIGTTLKEFNNSNFRLGNSEYLVIEADEYKRSFLNHYPKITILTNIEIDHLDYFKDLQDLKNAYKEFVSHLPEDGTLIVRKDYNIFNFKNTIEYSLKERLNLQVPGDYNQENANACLELAKILKIENAKESLEEFKGAWRRNEEIQKENYLLIRDYGHHPTQLLKTLKGIKDKYKNKHITCIYQPHQYKRTEFFFKQFTENFRKVSEYIDNLVITDVYDVAGREEKEKNVNSEILVEKIDKENVKYIPVKEIDKYIKENVKDILVIMSAGDFYTID